MDKQMGTSILWNTPQRNYWYMQKIGWVSKALFWVKETRYKGYMLSNSFYINFWKKQKYRNRNQISGCQELGIETEIDSKGMWENFLGVMELFYTLIVVLFTQVNTFVKSVNCTFRTGELNVNYTSLKPTKTITKPQRNIQKTKPFQWLPFPSE